MMTLTYRIGDSLYINLTNQCTNACSFCIRLGGDSVGGSDSLWLEREPEKEEVLKDIFRHDLSELKELVFCGYGEPMMRLDDLVWIAAQVKHSAPQLPIRINTNGQAELFYGPDAAARLQGVVDVVSISLNAPNARQYDEMCHSVYGEQAFPALLRFAQKCKDYIPTVILSVVDVMDGDDIEKCREIAKEIGVALRVREMIES